MKSLLRFSLTAAGASLALLIAGAGPVAAQTTVLVEDSFSRTGLLFGSEPSGGTADLTWSGSNSTGLSTNGSVFNVTNPAPGGVRASFLPVSLAVDSGIYTFSVTATVTSLTTGGYPGTGALMFGFTNSTDSTTQAQSSSASYQAGVNYRNDGRMVVWDRGVASSSLVSGFSNGTTPVTFTITIDTDTMVTADNVTFSDSVGVIDRSVSFTALQIAAITGIKLGVNGAEGTYDNLSVSVTAIPEPSSLAVMLGCAALVGTVAMRRKQVVCRDRSRTPSLPGARPSAHSSPAAHTSPDEPAGASRR